ncbi:MAG: NigD-like N-terminal domain-containing protein [Prevotella sp.]|nr:NigD-like N-terminal domain-containing protein [Prevotella sp.]
MKRMIRKTTAAEQPVGRRLRPAAVPFSAYFLILLFFFVACTNDPYESGDGKYSYFRADFVEAQTGNSRQIVGALTDDGDQLAFNPPGSCRWATAPDSVYRALLYYNKVVGGEPEYISLTSVSVLPFGRLKDDEPMIDDPVGFESAWVSRNGKYLNMQLALKTGVEEGLDAKQVIGAVLESVEELADGSHEFRLRFYHEQNGIPEYYSSRTYVSIPLSELRSGDAVRISVNTYAGEVVKSFVKE